MEEKMVTARSAMAKELFDAGKLQAAIDEITYEVKERPNDTRKRTFLFELLCFNGCWERAEKQLDVIGMQSAKAETGVQVYKNIFKAEQSRLDLFSEGIQPHFLIEPPAYIYLNLVAISQLHEFNIGDVRRLLDNAEEARASLSGKLNDKPFQDFRDYDDLVGPVLELFLQDKYVWLPFEQIKRIEIAPPKQLRDLLWASARVETINSTIAEIFLPVLYVGSSEHPNDLVKLGRMTDWVNLGQSLSLPAGQRLFLVDSEEKPILEVKSIEFDEIKKE
jgi:type VI secretion system protein ImpE